nr:MAG TPA: hypothetical protein [Caudoviricetes sp.]
MFTVALGGVEQSGVFQILNSSSDGSRRQLYIACYFIYRGSALSRT